ncbi:uncharacterized protein PODANS_3_1890 [Podospora anserina S mat+]|uniref:Podospora anserina S mat+ genomic DNA chromosome 3, supercontig 1 n=1 Tax=Podospora anserina (strain S / ATCC MYA-4624 / DSM 980 / FGSC 10383) TaxID=515849 RepID=B2ACR9_PODAN|nr:uncharacterized protein PODANS_3_1890 [Podospora anserina S mat+]CAP61234.1 unnamed protein product [Podospora anserina S mat+]
MVWRSEGGAGRRLWTGYTALVARNLPFTALQFPLFEIFRGQIWNWKRGGAESSHTRKDYADSDQLQDTRQSKETRQNGPQVGSCRDRFGDGSKCCSLGQPCSVADHSIRCGQNENYAQRRELISPGNHMGNYEQDSPKRGGAWHLSGSYASWDMDGPGEWLISGLIRNGQDLAQRDITRPS